MYFADLTPYSYDKHPERVGLNVGWLDKAHGFSSGTVPTVLIEKLIEISKKPFEKHRGFHICEFCDFGRMPDSPDKLNDWFLKLNAAGALSSTIIRVVGRDGRVYFSPNMICHYVSKHYYKPPEEFIDAVMETDLANYTK